MLIVYLVSGEMSIGKMTKNAVENLCNLPLDAKTGHGVCARPAQLYHIFFWLSIGKLHKKLRGCTPLSQVHLR
jgi:hypothetical protein